MRVGVRTYGGWQEDGSTQKQAKKPAKPGRMKQAEAQETVEERAAEVKEEKRGLLQTSFPKAGWCTVLHMRSAFRRGFFSEEFVERFGGRQERFLQWLNGLTAEEAGEFSGWPWTGRGELGRPEGRCWWVPFAAVQSLHPVELTTHLSLGPHYLEGYAVFHVPHMEELQSLWEKPSEADYRNVRRRIDPQEYPALQHEWAGSLISVVPAPDSPDGFSVVSLPEACSRPVALKTFPRWECFLIRPSLYSLPLEASLERTVGPCDDMQQLVRTYLEGRAEWAGTYHETDPEEGLWHIRYMVKGTPREHEFVAALQSIACGSPILRRPCVNVLNEIYDHGLL